MNINNNNMNHSEDHLDLDAEGIVQLAQITINGVYRYEMHWKPAANEVAIETVDSSLIGWQSDTLTVGETMSALLNVGIDNMRITGLGFFGLHVDDYHVASPEEDRDIYATKWNRIGADGYAVQFNVDIDYDYDDGSAPPRHESESEWWRDYWREEREEARYRERYDNTMYWNHLERDAI